MMQTQIMQPDAPTKPIRILLVDDNPTNLKVLAEAINGKGWSVLIANDGESAIEQTEYAKPDLILLDVMMPGIDGFETCQRLKANAITQSIPIIFMTALSDTVDKVKGLTLGAVDYITKPFQRDEVIARVQLHLQLAQLTQTLAQRNELLNQKIAEQAATEAALQHLNHDLEQRVEQRTHDLSRSLQQLQQAQLQLVQSEKMSALGQLVAGVAHEINNPVGFIAGNLQPAQTYVQDLFDLIDLYQARLGQSDPTIVEKIEEIDLDYIRQDLPKLIASMREGVDRIRDISTSLRTFSRADTDQKVAFNLHAGIDSTLLILKHRLKANEHRPAIEIHKAYGDLPPIDCYPGQLNQVFMNILANAIDALDELTSTRTFADLEANPHQIDIQTSALIAEKTVIIRIKDNGSGIPDDIKARIFDHLFTTKAVGQGTGLGLSIARRIVEEIHGGQLQCESQIGKGTAFIMQVPL